MLVLVAFLLPGCSARGAPSIVDPAGPGARRIEGASNDVIAKWFHVPVNALTWMFRILVFAVPAFVAWRTHRYMEALRLSGVDRWNEVPLRALISPTIAADPDRGRG